jgi:hypothetical protein
MSAANHEDLARHIGHRVVCVSYGGAAAAVECETCGEVLFDLDAESEVEAVEPLGDLSDVVTELAELNDGEMPAPMTVLDLLSKAKRLARAVAANGGAS